ncbi:inositol 1,4,5-triphosphate receptor associated 2 isoform X2 [Boleophthalmus pectinirostris]|uniref:inositol 1,4,5-triphosphate receptor associated 2 isoform X2 n=1 Tax=Boleophthalmus pectinirostris TaxID=150288 RepID=UPI00243086FF|nr:inositol 1,4,5-triphosphate receptor associated 2 isoform X2 [Boleophthalmus pectinirostris]
MEYCTPQPTRRHNPVDSICKKLQTIQWRREREPNSPFQIPKFSSSSYDSPQCGLRSNLEALLKKGALYRELIDREKDKAMGMPSSAASNRTSMGPPTPVATPATPNYKPTTSNVTYTITSTLGERKGADGNDLKHVKMWQRYCSTPTNNTNDSPYFTFTRGQQSVQPDSERAKRSPPTMHTFTPFHTTASYNLNFSSADATNTTECEVPYPALVVKRLSMGDTGMSTADGKKGNMAEISLICEENLLDTIFHACDTQRRGKVYVSHIVDYLRHTTSRSSEDSGLEELCNMLDPEHKDVSIDLDTYHAVMREWIDDCRNNGEETAEEVTQDSVKMRDSISARRSMLLNMTSGSLEAFGGEVSRVEFETSELMYCVTDLQLNNQKLQDEVKKLKQVVESMEDTNQKLVEESEGLRNQAKTNQQLAQKEKMLKDEVEEMKATLSNTEEGRARASAHSKHMERENQSLIAKIASLQEENFKVTMETDELQKRISELCDINADLQVQIHSFDGVLSEKDVELQEKMRQINELKATVEEYSSITELLRADKSKLENQMQMLHPDLIGGLSLSVAYRLNQSITGSLQSELALAQFPLEPLVGVDPLSTTSLDETLDKEVLLMMQGPSPEHMSQEFKNIVNKLKHNLLEETGTVMCTVQGLLDDHTKMGFNTDKSLQAFRAELDTRRADWAHSLDQLAQYTDSLEKELIKMASNMRRSRTEILHLSVRVQEQENQKRQLCEELEQLRTPQDSREASCQTPAAEEEPGQDLDWDEEFDIQDYMKNEEVTNNYCSVDVGPPEGPQSEETGHKRTEKRDKEGNEEGDKRAASLAEDSDAKEKSTLYINVYMETQSRQEALETHHGAEAGSEPQAVVNHKSVQEEGALSQSAHSQAVGAGHPEADPGPTHLNNYSAEESKAPQTVCDLPQNNSIETEPNKVTERGASTDDTVDHKLSSTSAPEEDQKGEGFDQSCKEASEMSRKSLGQDKADRTAEDSSSLLPVLVEEEETEASTATASVSASEHHMSSSHQSRGSTAAMANSVSPKKDLQQLQGKKELELSRGIETGDQLGTKGDRSQTTSNNDEVYQHSDVNDSYKEDKNGMTPTDKEVEAEFQRLALGFKCDMFTLEKRLRLEERSRDLAEENVRREVSSCQGLLQALIPLCEDDNQSMEIILRLQKNLEILIQSMTRVSSRSEMLGAIHQENRIGKAVEVMIQHVENLRRMYTKEHAELLELRETLMQNERSFGSQTKKDDFQGKKTQGRRVSLPPIHPINMRKPQDMSEVDHERLTRRSPWSAGRNMARPPLKRFVSSAPWVDSEDPCDMMKGSRTDNHLDEEPKEEAETERRSSLSELGNKLTSLLLPNKTPSPSSSPTSSDPGVTQSLSRGLGSSRASAAAVARGSRTVWLWLAMFVLLAGLLALLASLVMQPAVDAAPVGTGDSWMTIQQLLWPYTGLRHNGQPPV